MQTIALTLAMLHVSALILGFVLGNKSADLGPLLLTLTVLSYPIVLLTTDLLNEHCGRSVARRVTVISFACVAMTYLLIELARRVPASSGTHLPPGAFEHVLVVPVVDLVALVTGYVAGQLTDIETFHRLRERTGRRLLWVRVVGSTTVGEIVDASMVSGLLIASTKRPDAATLVDLTLSQAVVRIGIGAALLPVIYLVHHVVARRELHRDAS